MSRTGIIYGINGPVIYLKGNTGFKMSEMVHVGEEHLVGEVISLKKDTTTVQVFEETSGLKPGENCYSYRRRHFSNPGPRDPGQYFRWYPETSFCDRPEFRKIYFPGYAGRFSGHQKALGCAYDHHSRHGSLRRHYYRRGS